MKRKIEIEHVGTKYRVTGYVTKGPGFGWTGACLKSTGSQTSAIKVGKEFLDIDEDKAHKLIYGAGVQVVTDVEEGDRS